MPCSPLYFFSEDWESDEEEEEKAGDDQDISTWRCGECTFFNYSDRRCQMCDAKFDPRWAVRAGGGVGADEEAGTTEKSEKENIVEEDLPKEKQEEEAGIETEGKEVAGPEKPITQEKNPETEGKITPL